MLFEKLVQQHRVHRVVTDGVNFPVLVAHDQRGVHLFHILSHETELRCTAGIERGFITKVTGLSPRIASLALSIGLISSLNRAEETTVPNWPLAPTTTGTPTPTTVPKMPAMKVEFWLVPIRITFDSSVTPWLPMSMLAPPVTMLLPAL